MVSKAKLKTVEEIKAISKEYPIVGIVDLNNLPTPQLQEMRAQLRDKVVLKTTKKTLILRILDDIKGEKKDIDQLKNYIKGIPALLFTKESPFKLFKTLKKNKSFTFAKPGQEAPTNITVKAGPTNFSPGPIIGELGALGIKSGVDKGKIAIKEDKVVVKEGEVINSKVASLLTRLDIKPMEVGLNLTAAYENGTIYDKKILSVDEQEYINKITQFHKEAINLSFNAGIYTKETIKLFITETFRNAKNLSVSSNIITDDTVGDILAKAEREANALNNIN